MAAARPGAAAQGTAGLSLVQTFAIFSVGRLSSSLSRATSTGVTAAAIQVPRIHSCEVMAAADAEAALAITSVRMFRRRSSSRASVRVDEATRRHHSEAQETAASMPRTTPEWAVQASVRGQFRATSARTPAGLEGPMLGHLDQGRRRPRHQASARPAQTAADPTPAGRSSTSQPEVTSSTVIGSSTTRVTRREWASW